MAAGRAAGLGEYLLHRARHLPGDVLGDKTAGSRGGPGGGFGAANPLAEVEPEPNHGRGEASGDRGSLRARAVRVGSWADQCSREDAVPRDGSSPLDGRTVADLPRRGRCAGRASEETAGLVPADCLSGAERLQAAGRHRICPHSFSAVRRRSALFRRAGHPRGGQFVAKVPAATAIALAVLVIVGTASAPALLKLDLPTAGPIAMCPRGSARQEDLRPYFEIRSRVTFQTNGGTTCTDGVAPVWESSAGSQWQ